MEPSERAVLSTNQYAQVLDAVISLLDQARAAAVRSVNAVMTATYWSVGRVIVEQEQGGFERASYGEELLAKLSTDLTRRFGRGFSARNLRQFRQFYLTWPPELIWQTLSTKSPTDSSMDPIWQTASAKSVITTAPADQPVDIRLLAQMFPLPWSSYVRLLSVKSSDARDFYETEALRNGWTVRQLSRQVNSLFYERAALSKNKAAMLRRGESSVETDVMTADEAIKDPFVLEFLGLKDEYSESDLEDALIDHLAEFLMELGDDYAFLARQRRLRLDDSWFRVDLVLYHRALRCLLLVDLKLGRFSYQDAGQMHLYLNYARENWTKPGENPPAGLILCSEKGVDEAHYALDGLSGVLVAEYQTALPDEEILVAELARTRVELEARASLRVDTQPTSEH